MSSSLSQPKFIFDENVDERLKRFLKTQGVDVISKPKGLSNGKLAEFSKSEKRVLVTNDRDFVEFDEKNIFSIILLKIPQRKIDVLKKSFSKLIKNKSGSEDFEGSVIILKGSSSESHPLGSEVLIK